MFLTIQLQLTEIEKKKLFAIYYLMQFLIVCVINTVKP